MEQEQIKTIAAKIQSLIFDIPVEEDQEKHPGFLPAVRMVFASSKTCQQKPCGTETLFNMLDLLSDAIEKCQTENPIFNTVRETIAQLRTEVHQCAA